MKTLKKLRVVDKDKKREENRRYFKSKKGKVALKKALKKYQSKPDIKVRAAIRQRFNRYNELEVKRNSKYSSLIEDYVNGEVL